jgi:hypothetical protein
MQVGKSHKVTPLRDGLVHDSVPRWWVRGYMVRTVCDSPRIVTPGRFEGEHPDIVEAWEITLDGLADQEWHLGGDGDVSYYALVTLRSGERLIVHDNDQGFISIVFRDADDEGQRGSAVESGIKSLNAVERVDHV